MATGGSIPLLCLEGVPRLPGEPQDEARLSMVLTDTWQGAVETSVLIKYICLKDFMAVYG